MNFNEYIKFWILSNQSLTLKIDCATISSIQLNAMMKIKLLKVHFKRVSGRCKETGLISLNHFMSVSFEIK